MPSYGQPHRRVKERLVREWLAAPYPCPRCGREIVDPMLADAGHDDDRVGAPASRLEHASCNRVAGAVKGNDARTLRPSREW